MSLSRLEALAYGMLGSVADAEDVVQEARLKLIRQQAPPDNEQAWLFRVVTNLALDRLREQKRRRESYPGPWLPEPLPTSEPDEIAELAENLSMGLVLMLERLSPAERVVFVLREGFDLGYDDIAALVDVSAAGCRQRYRRARAHLTGESRFKAGDGGAQRVMLERLLAAIAARDLDGVASLLAEDCVAYADGGGVVSAAIRPVTERQRIATVTVHLAGKLAAEGALDFHWVPLNGGVGVLVTLDGVLVSSLQVELQVEVDRPAADGAGHGNLIERIYIMRNPEKLAHLASLLE